MVLSYAVMKVDSLLVRTTGENAFITSTSENDCFLFRLIAMTITSRSLS